MTDDILKVLDIKNISVISEATFELEMLISNCSKVHITYFDNSIEVLDEPNELDFFIRNKYLTKSRKIKLNKI